MAFEVEAHDAHSLLFAFLDELLFRFHTDMTVCRRVQVGPIDRVNWRVRCVGRGERFVDGVHEQGTEIKAITYSAMQIVDRANPLTAPDEGARRRRGRKTNAPRGTEWGREARTPSCSSSSTYDPRNVASRIGRSASDVLTHVRHQSSLD